MSMPIRSDLILTCKDLSSWLPKENGNFTGSAPKEYVIPLGLSHLKLKDLTKSVHTHCAHSYQINHSA